VPVAPRLIVGCGYLGRRVAARWVAGGGAVYALTRNRADELRGLGLIPVIGDVTDPASLRGLPPAETVLYAVGLDRAAGRSMREVYVTGLANVLDALPGPRRFVYVSSTGVYGQSDGGWVDEGAPAELAEESGRVVREAERLLHQRLPGAVILRFAGIYGPGRLLRQQAIRAGEPLAGDPEQWLNLVHVDDGAAAVEAAANRGRPCGVYNVSDGTPVTRRAFFTLLAELIGAPPPRFEPAPGGANRRIDSRRMREELGVTPAYPSYETGLPAALAKRAHD
jgi:nucleoside-diphosphate-sugar epimerase